MRCWIKSSQYTSNESNVLVGVGMIRRKYVKGRFAVRTKDGVEI